MQAPSLVWESALEKEMETHCSILVWKPPWTEAPGGLQSRGRKRVRHNLDTEQQHCTLCVCVCVCVCVLNHLSGVQLCQAPLSRVSPQPRDQTHISYISYIGRWVLYHRRHLSRPEGETEVQRREMTYSRSPARCSHGPDQSPRPLTPQAPWRSLYVEFPREDISVSRNTPTQQS